MSVSYSAPLKSTRMQAVIAAIDANAAPGFVEIGTAGMAQILCVITFGKPSFTENAGTITMTGAPKSGTGLANGTAVNARVKDGGSNIVISGLTVGVGSGEIQLNSTQVISGMQVTLTSATITHSP